MGAPKKRRRWVFGLIAGAIAGLAVFALRPAPVLVETARAARGTMQVTVDEDGETRAHDRFVIATPISGRLMRVELEEGDSVRPNEAVATIEPLPLNQQQREEVLGRIAAAENAQRSADARAQHARADYEQSRRERARAEQLARGGVISAQAVEQARITEVTAMEELHAAEFSAKAAAAEVQVARSGLLGIVNGSSGERRITLRSPIAGRVLRVAEKSERVVPAGTLIIVLGDPKRIEVVADILTTDAVNIKPGAAVLLEGWGGDHPIRAKVRLIEPSGFTKVSALGVEEKRVNVIADFVDPPGPLGDGYRVEARIVVWEGENVLKIPASAAFRQGEGWGVFVATQGRASRRSVQIGHRNPNEIEVLGGLREGDQVILHPSNDLREGARIRAR